MKNICLIIHSLGIGGMERVMSELAGYFSERKGVSVNILLIGRDRLVSYDLPAGVEVHRPDFEYKSGQRGFMALKTMRFIRSEVSRLDPDVVLSFGEIWNNLVLLSLLGHSVPVCISDRSEPGKNLGRLHNFLRERLYPGADGYIAQTTKAADHCRKKNWNRNILVAGNPIRSVEGEQLDQREKTVLFVGRLIHTKHVDDLIRIFHSVREEGWRLIVIGGNAKNMDLLSEYRLLLKELGAGSSIELLGERKDVEDFYRKASLFAFTSSSEGFPNVVGEALSAGLPVVSYDCVAGPGDMIQSGHNGFLVPVHDQKGFGEKLRLLMTDGELRHRMARNAPESIQNFSVERIGEKVYDFIDYLIKKRGES